MSYNTKNSQQSKTDDFSYFSIHHVNNLAYKDNIGTAINSKVTMADFKLHRWVNSNSIYLLVDDLFVFMTYSVLHRFQTSILYHKIQSVCVSVCVYVCPQ